MKRNRIQGVKCFSTKVAFALDAETPKQKEIAWVEYTLGHFKPKKKAVNKKQSIFKEEVEVTKETIKNPFRTTITSKKVKLAMGSITIEVYETEVSEYILRGMHRI